MKKQYIIAAAISYVLLFSGIYYWTTFRKSEHTPLEQAQDFKENVASDNRITQKILHSTSEATSAGELVNIVESENALALIKRTHSVVTKDYEFGTLVESIDGVKNGTDNKYWILYVNGKQATVGAGAYTIQKNDTIEWRHEAYETIRKKM
jgi:hypothetical protein